MRQIKNYGAALLCGLALTGPAPGAFARLDDTCKISPDRPEPTAATTPEFSAPLPASALDRAAPPATEAPDRPAAQTPVQLQTLVAPIALYPDALVGQALAAAAAPTQIVLANRWLKQHNKLKGEALAREVNAQPWDPAVRSLTQFPAVLADMDTNLSWTTALGDAYVQQPQDVLDAVQVMRRKAENAKTLRTTPQQSVTTQGKTIIIAPANPEIIYVPQYNPWLAYGGPLLEYPGWIPCGGFYYGRPGLSFGIGFGIGLFAGFGFDWNHWNANYHNHTVIYNHTTYITHGGGYYGGGERRYSTAYHSSGYAGPGAFHRGGSDSSGYRGGGLAPGAARSSGLSDYLHSRGSAEPGRSRRGSPGGSGFGRGGASSPSSGGGFRSSAGGGSRGGSFGGGRTYSGGSSGRSGSFSGSASRSGGYSGGSSHSGGGYSGGGHGGGRR